MLKHLMSGSSLLALTLREGENNTGADDKNKLREQIAKGNLPAVDKEEKNGEENEETKEDDDEDDEGEDKKEEDEKIEETTEQKATREANDKVAAKAQRKQDRMQRRIDEAIADRKAAEAALKAFKDANPDVKLTEAEVEAKAEAIATQKLAARQAETIQANFDNACAKLMKEAIKIDKDFDDKVNDMAEQFGRIPSFMIGVLEDLDNGAEVLALMANDDDVAEKLYDLKSPAKVTKELVAISNKLSEAKKKPKKEISKVPDPIEPVNGNRHVSTVITEADTKDMPSYVAKRRAQQEATRKARGY